MKPELQVRTIVHSMGHRYRLHVGDLPGKPDLVFRPKKKVIEVRGCFWHQHLGCIDGRVPKSRAGYWIPKLARNQQRDRENETALRALGWKVLIVWECELADLKTISRKIGRFLHG